MDEAAVRQVKPLRAVGLAAQHHHCTGCCCFAEFGALRGERFDLAIFDELDGVNHVVPGSSQLLHFFEVRVIAAGVGTGLAVRSPVVFGSHEVATQEGQLVAVVFYQQWLGGCLQVLPAAIKLESILLVERQALKQGVRPVIHQVVPGQFHHVHAGLLQ